MMSLPYQGNNGRQLYNHVPACSKHVGLPVPEAKTLYLFVLFFLSFMNRQIINRAKDSHHHHHFIKIQIWQIF